MTAWGVELAAVVPDADYNEMHVASRDANLEVNRPQSGALLCPAVQTRDSRLFSVVFISIAARGGGTRNRSSGHAPPRSIARNDSTLTWNLLDDSPNFIFVAYFVERKFQQIYSRMEMISITVYYCCSSRAWTE